MLLQFNNNSNKIMYADAFINSRTFGINNKIFPIPFFPILQTRSRGKLPTCTWTKLGGLNILQYRMLTASDGYILLGTTLPVSPWLYWNKSVRNCTPAVRSRWRPGPTWPTWTKQRDHARFQIRSSKSKTCNRSLIDDAVKISDDAVQWWRGGIRRSLTCPTWKFG